MSFTSYAFDKYESEVRVYCRKFPSLFLRAKDHLIWDESNRQYIDFMSGSGALNYGHNNEFIKNKLIQYIIENGITHSLDLHTGAKQNFILSFIEDILAPRKLDYKIQFTGPTGSNSVEAAFKIARKVTKRHTIIAFTNGFHGTSLGSLSATGNKKKRVAAGVPLNNVLRMPFDGYLGENQNTVKYIESLLDDPSSGIDFPAAFIVETIQVEGGMFTATKEWLKDLQSLANRKNILLILDDIQSGCGRTGTFFSFENYDIYPDIVCLSKSISGYGLPMALTLLRRDIDQQESGEHSGTFRGNNHAFITAKAAISFWVNKEFLEHVNKVQNVFNERLSEIAKKHQGSLIQGRGLLRGIKWENIKIATCVSRQAFKNGLIAETSGGYDHVLKIMPPITIDIESLNFGFDIIESSIQSAFNEIN